MAQLNNSTWCEGSLSDGNLLYDKLISTRDYLDTKINQLPKIKFVSKILHGKSGGDSVVVYTIKELREMFGFDRDDSTIGLNNFFIIPNNGDGTSASVHYQSCTRSGEYYYTVFDNNEVGSSRHNLIIMYFPVLYENS